MKKKMILLLVIMLTIGFASVSASLVLNGKTSVAFDKNNLQVIFTRVRLNNEESENIIITDEGKSFVYIADNLTNVGDTVNIEYDIKNGSTIYDTKVAVSCTTDYQENIEYNGNTLDQLIDIKAAEGYTDTLTTKLTNINTSSSSIALKCTLILNPLDRDTIMLGKEYNVDFDSNGGSTIDSNIVVKYYEKYGELPTPTKANDEFLGWYTEDGKKIDSNSIVKVKDNHTLIAKWSEKWDFNYTGDAQEFIAPFDGTYKIELWGAQGGKKIDSGVTGGFGAYTAGTIKLSKEKNIYVYVGIKSGATHNSKTFNNGTSSNYGWNGGGSTDIRLTNGTWDDFTSIKSRIMVAAGGGTAYEDGFAGEGGGLIGIAGGGTSGGTQISFGESQTSGYPASKFGIANGGCTGGNGYYPGGGATCANGSGGGSSFISGHVGCDAISKTSLENNIIHTGEPNHYSGYIFTNTKMIDGTGYAWTDVKGTQEQMPNPSGGYYDLGVGHSGNGHARITLISIDNNM